MNRAIFTFILVASSVSLMAQKKGTHELGLGYGLASFSDIEIAFEVFDTQLDYANNIIYDFTEESGTAAISLIYKYAATEKLSFGASYTYQSFSFGVTESLVAVDERGTSIGKRSYLANTVILSAAYKYIAQPNFQLYSGLGWGYSIVSEKFNLTKSTNILKNENHSRLGVQLDLLGVRVGNKVAGFFELGLGNAGVLKGGISIEFN